jgi:hypothetical protein
LEKIHLPVGTRGFIPPGDFIKIFDDIKTPDLINQGEFNKNLINKVINGEFKLKDERMVR